MWLVGSLAKRLLGQSTAKPSGLHWPPRRCDLPMHGNEEWRWAPTMPMEEAASEQAKTGDGDDSNS